WTVAVGILGAATGGAVGLCASAPGERRLSRSTAPVAECRIWDSAFPVTTQPRDCCALETGNRWISVVDNRVEKGARFPTSHICIFIGRRLQPPAFGFS